MREQRIKVLKDVLALDTTNSNEELMADYLADLFADNVIVSEKLQYSPGRASLIAEMGQGNRVFGLSGHMDVVSAGDPSLWTNPPFEPTQREGKIFARGATDMKSGLAAMVMAMIELKRENVNLKGKIKLLATVGEEIGLLGARQLTDEGYASDLETLIIGEPTGHRIIYAHKGVITYTVTSYGKSAHSSMPELGVNAIDNLIIFCNRIHEVFSKLDASNEALGKFVVNNSVIQGGEQVNSVPSLASMKANLRTTPEVNNDIVIKALETVVQELNSSVEGMELILEINQSTLPVFGAPNSPLVQLAKTKAEAMFGHPVELLGMPGGADSAEFIRGNPDMQIIIFGPGNETLHQVDEYVEIDNYLEMIDLYKEIIVSYLA